MNKFSNWFMVAGSFFGFGLGCCIVQKWNIASISLAVAAVISIVMALSLEEKLIQAEKKLSLKE